jgi:hypothetical protein
MKTFLDERPDGSFYAHFSEDKADPMFFRILPGEVEEIRLSHRAEISSLKDFPPSPDFGICKPFYMTTKSISTC